MSDHPDETTDQNSDQTDAPGADRWGPEDDDPSHGQDAEQADSLPATADDTDTARDRNRLSREEREQQANQTAQREQTREVASMDKFRPGRDEHGDLIPQWAETPQGDYVKAKPLEYGAVKRYFEADADEQAIREARANARGQGPQAQQATAEQIQAERGADDLDDSDLAEIASLYIVEPNVVADAKQLQKAQGRDDLVRIDSHGRDVVTENYLDLTYPLAPRDWLMAVIDVSGLGDVFDVEMAEDEDRQVQVQQSGN